ncbi:hypothetical protein HN873_061341 [Arachis hypogaea]
MHENSRLEQGGKLQRHCQHQHAAATARPGSTSRRWERHEILKRSTEVDCCPHTVDGGAASDEGGGEVYPMILVLWRGRG